MYKVLNLAGKGNIHPPRMVLKNYNCPGNDLISCGQKAIENDVTDLGLCIAYCQRKPGADAGTLNPNQKNRCYCKTKTCHNAEITDLSKGVVLAYKGEL